MNVATKFWYNSSDPFAVKAANAYNAIRSDMLTARRRTLLGFRKPWASLARGAALSLVVMAAATRHQPWVALGMLPLLYMTFWGIIWAVTGQGSKFVLRKLAKNDSISIMVPGDRLWVALEKAFSYENLVKNLAEVLACEQDVDGVEKLIADFVKRRHELENPDDLALVAGVTAGQVARKIFAVPH